MFFIDNQNYYYASLLNKLYVVFFVLKHLKAASMKQNAFC